MSTITGARKQRYRELRAQADDAIAKLNTLFEETARPYRARLDFFEPPAAIDDDDAPDDDDLPLDRPRGRADAPDGPYAEGDDPPYHCRDNEDGED